MSKRNTFFLILLFIFSSFNTIAQFGGGAGTAASPYIVANETHLNNVRNFLNSHFVQTNDIDLTSFQSGSGWLPIGTLSSPFSGVYRGNGFRIRNLKINRPNSENIGLFGVIKGTSTSVSRLVDIHLEYVEIIGDKSVGSLLGFIDNDENTQVLLCSVEVGAVKGRSNVGGLIGSAHGAKTGPASYSQTNIGSCFSYVNVHYNAQVSNLQNFGGLVGYVSRGQLNNCYSFGAIFAINNVGGITYIAEVVGGLIGGINQGYVYNCYSASVIIGMNNHFGGLIGAIYGSGIFGTDYFSFWDIESSGVNVSSGGNGKPTEWFMEPSNFNGWDFSNFWAITPGFNNGYPYLIHNMPMFLLPISLSKISAERFENSIQLTWQTYSENNNNGFYILKSYNCNDFKKIGFISGNGNSNSIKDYVFFDTQISNKEFVYYKLKQEDFDGNYSFSEIVSVSPLSLKRTNVFPNPFDHYLIIEFEDDETECELILYDNFGRIVLSQNLFQSITLQLNNLAKGMYFVEIYKNGVSDFRKIVKK